MESSNGPDGGYQLTAVGRELAPVLKELGSWVATWIMEDPSPAEADPGLPLAVTVRSSVVDFYRVYMGRSRLVDEIAAGRAVLEGLPRDQRSFHRWMKWSTFAPASERGMALRTASVS